MDVARPWWLAALAGLAMVLLSPVGWAGEANLREELDELRKLVQQQADMLQDQQERMAAQQRRIADLEKKVQAAVTEDVQVIRQELDKVMAAPGARPLGPNDLRVFWKEGLRFENADKTFALKLGGRVMADWSWMDEESEIRDRFGSLEDGFEFRRVRLYGAGKIYGNTDYKLQFDFAGNDVSLKDAYLGFPTLVPLGYLKVGHFKEPFSLEELTSSKYITFMERALPVGAFSPSRNAGAQLSNHHLDDRLTWAAGVFRDVDAEVESRSEGGYNLTARLTGLPWYAEDGAKLFHLGVAASRRDPKANDREIEFETRPALHLAPKLVGTDALLADQASLLGAETALVYGPLSLQGEFITANADLIDGAGNANFDGAYVEASYFLTGEHRKYKKSAGAFSRVKPKQNYGDGGLGAWQVATRYDYVDLDDADIMGGKLDALTFGLNWHLNPNTRIMFNYSNALLESEGRTDLFGARFQVDF